jgi:hypothetical protein
MHPHLMNTPANRNALVALYRAGATLILADDSRLGELTVLDASDVLGTAIRVETDLDTVEGLLELQLEFGVQSAATTEAIQALYTQLEQAHGRTADESAARAAQTDRLYHAWIDADNTWQAALERHFGRNAGDMRYREEGHTGPELAPLWEAFRAAQDAWRAHTR